MADAQVEALRASVARLRDLVSTMSDADLTRPAYPRQWSIADVLSHIGSGAVIMHRRLDDTRAGLATPDDFAPESGTPGTPRRRPPSATTPLPRTPPFWLASTPSPSTNVGPSPWTWAR